MICQMFHTVSRMRENCTYGSMRGRTYPAGASRSTLHTSGTVRRKDGRKKDKNLRYRSSEDDNRSFAFRIRTRRNERGEIIEAFYNPTPNDRNLEFDRKANLNRADRKW